MAILIPIFLAAFASILVVVGLGTSYFKSKQRNQIRSMLQNAEASPAAQRASGLLRETDEDNSISDLLKRFSFIERLDLMIEQSGQKTTSSKLLLLSVFALVGGFIFGSRFSFCRQVSQELLVVCSALPCPF